MWNILIMFFNLFIFIFCVFLAILFFKKRETAFLGNTNRKICKDYPQILPFPKANVEHKDSVIAYMCF